MSMSNVTGPAPFHIFPAFRGCKRPYALAIIIFVVMLTMLEYAAGSDQSMANLMFACVLASMSIGMYWLPACCGIASPRYLLPQHCIRECRFLHNFGVCGLFSACWRTSADMCWFPCFSSPR